MTTVYATQVTQYYLNRDAAISASGSSPSPAPPFNFPGGTFAVGDGGGTVPSISTLIAQGGLVNQVWSGATISGVAQDATKLNQIDITCVVPDTQGGVEVGGFTIREFAIYDELGQLCVVGVTNIEKTLSTEGQINTIMLVAAIATASTNNVVITPPTGQFRHASAGRNRHQRASADRRRAADANRHHRPARLAASRLRRRERLRALRRSADAAGRRRAWRRASGDGERNRRFRANGRALSMALANLAAARRAGDLFGGAH